MAERTLLLRVIADDRALQAAMARDQKAVAAFGKSAEGNLGKVDAAFTRTQKLMAGGFVGAVAFGAVTRGISAVAQAAAESEQVLGQTRVALESTGKSWSDYGSQVEQAVKAQSRLGFDDEELLKTFSLFVRQTKDVGAALRNNNIAMDIARARFIDLEAAAALVNKAALGQAGALRRIGIDAKTGASGVELLAQLEREFGGAAEEASDSAAASLDRYNVAVENLKEKFGSALLPAMTEFVNMLTRTIEGAEAAADALGKIGDVKIPAIKIPLFFDFGGGSIGGAVSGSFDFLQGIEDKILNAVGADARDAARDIAVGVDDAAERFAEAVSNVPEKFTNAIAAKGFRKPNPSLVGIREAIASFTGAATNAAKEAVDEGQRRIDKAAQETKLRESFDKLIANLRLDVDRAGLTKFLGDDIGALEDLAAGLRRQIAAGIDAEQAQVELVQVIGRLADLEAEKQENLKRAAAAQKQAQQFRALGLSSEGEEIVPGVENLEKRLRSALGRIASDDLDVGSKVADRLKLAAKLIKREGKNLTETTRRTIDEFIKAATGQDKKLDGPLTKASSLNVNKLLAGLEIDPNLIRQLRSRLSSVNSAGQGLPGTVLPTGMFRGGVAAQVNAAQPIDITLLMDGDVVARKTGFYDQRTKRRNPRQKTGPNSGI